MSKEAMLTAEVAVLTEMVRVLSAKVEQQEQGESMRPEIRKMYEDYFDKCFAESSQLNKALEEAQKQEQGEPVAWYDDIHQDFSRVQRIGWKPLVFADTTPQQRKPLTNKQLFEHWQVAKVSDMTHAEIDIADYVLIARDVEALHGIKE